MRRQSKPKPDRRLVFTIIIIAVLLYGMWTLFTANNRKYENALQAASTAIELNNRAIRDDLATDNATTVLSVTLTSVIATGAPTPSP